MVRGLVAHSGSRPLSTARPHGARLLRSSKMVDAGGELHGLRSGQHD